MIHHTALSVACGPKEPMYARNTYKPAVSGGLRAGYNACELTSVVRCATEDALHSFERASRSSKSAHDTPQQLQALCRVCSHEAYSAARASRREPLRPKGRCQREAEGLGVF